MAPAPDTAMTVLVRGTDLLSRSKLPAFLDGELTLLDEKRQRRPRESRRLRQCICWKYVAATDNVELAPPHSAYGTGARFTFE